MLRRRIAPFFSLVQMSQPPVQDVNNAVFAFVALCNYSPTVGLAQKISIIQVQTSASRRSFISGWHPQTLLPIASTTHSTKTSAPRCLLCSAIATMIPVLTLLAVSAMVLGANDVSHLAICLS